MKFEKELYWPDDETHLNVQGPTYQEEIFNKSLEYVPEFDCVALDIGAHVGIWSKRLAEHFAGVIAFEPNPSARECLIKNAPEVMVIPAALGARPTQLVFTQPQPGNTGYSTVLPMGAHTLDKVAFTGVAMRLDDFNLCVPLGYMKIDVEGQELAVLQGGVRTIQVNRPLIVIELKGLGPLKDDPAAPANFLTKLGYEFKYRISHDHIFAPIAGVSREGLAGTDGFGGRPLLPAS